MFWSDQVTIIIVFSVSIVEKMTASYSFGSCSTSSSAFHVTLLYTS